MARPDADRRRPWPTPQDYNEALQNPKTSFAEPELRRGLAGSDALGIPKPITGNFATVYRVQTGKDVHAVRCFLRSVPDQQERYELISRHLAAVRLPQAVEFQFVAQGIMVKGDWYPILKMDWVQGTTLSTYVERHLNDRRTINQLAEAFVELLGDLQSRRIAHGDLQHGNLLVVDGRTGPALKLIDYDGMWVPALDGRESAELGHVNYQHPARSRRDYGSTLDSFSAWVILASLLGTRADPGVWNAIRHAKDDDRLLLGKADYADPLKSPALGRLTATKDAAAQRAAARVISLCPPGERVLGLPPPTDEDLRGGRELKWLPDRLAPLAPLGSLAASAASAATSAAVSAGQEWWRSRNAPDGGAPRRAPGASAWLPAAAAPKSGAAATGPTPPGPPSARPASQEAPPTTPHTWALPPVDLLGSPESSLGAADAVVEARVAAKLQSLGIKARITGRHRGPTGPVFDVDLAADAGTPSPGVLSPLPFASYDTLRRLQDAEADFAVAVAAERVGIALPLPGSSAATIEVVRGPRVEVDLRRIITEVDCAATGYPLTFALGCDAGGLPVAVSLGRMPHLLVAGAAGSGKSVMLNALVASLLCTTTPDEVRFILIDTARVELAAYNGLPHLVVPVASTPESALGALQWALSEMQSRLLRLAASSVRDVAAYNAGRADPADRLPRIVIVIDDYSDLLANSNEIEDPVIRLSGNASAAGIHLVLATHRPSLNVITSVVKANFRARIAFRTISEADSLAVLEAAGAEQLVGAGDMLYQPPDVPEPVRIQGLLVADVDIARITAHWMAQRPAPTHGLSIVAAPAAQQPAGLAEPTDDPDPLISDAVAAIQESRYASASLLMRKLRVGYARAARIIDQLEARGHVGPIDGSNARVVLHPDPPAPADDPDDAPQPWIARQARIEARLSDEDWLRQHEAMEHERLRGDHGPR